MEVSLGCIIFTADIWAVVQTVQRSVTTGIKIVWVVIILVLPVPGLISLFFLRPKPLQA